ncbi:MAG: hypothetical protein ACHQVS_03915 [Candidatus Babeliales bacterium]
MKFLFKLMLGLFIFIPGLYAMDEDAQFQKERKTKMERSAFATDEELKEDLDVIAARDAIAEQSEEIIAHAVAKNTGSLEGARTAAALLPTNVQEHIWSFADEENRKKRFVGMNMEQLIPAVIEWVDDGLIFDRIAQMKINRVTLDEIHRLRELWVATGELPATIALADKLYYMGSSYWEGERRISYEGAPFIRFMYSVVNGHRNTGTDVQLTPLLSTQRQPMHFLSSRNQFYALYYSNGTTLFKVHDAKFAELEKLSDKQLKYITNLYHTRARNLAERNTAEIHLTPEQFRTHKSLPTSMRVNLQNMYDLAEIKQERTAANRRKQCCTRLAFASLAATLGLPWAKLFYSNLHTA